jgi:hypothetical protein
MIAVCITMIWITHPHFPQEQILETAHVCNCEGMYQHPHVGGGKLLLQLPALLACSAVEQQTSWIVM